jgi:DNA-binding NarL/FixJ family response regulator
MKQFPTKTTILVIDSEQAYVIGLQHYIQSNSYQFLTIYLDITKKVSNINLPIPELILLNLNSYPQREEEAILSAHSLFPNSQIITLLENYTPQQFLTALANGTKGFCTQQTSPAELEKAFTIILDGNYFIDRRLNCFATLLQCLNLIWQESNIFQTVKQVLTKREQEIIALLEKNYSPNEIATFLQIAPATCRKHLEKIKQKTGTKNLGELNKICLVSNLLDCYN